MIKQKVKRKKEKVVNISNKESFIVFLDVVRDQINTKELDKDRL